MFRDRSQNVFKNVFKNPAKIFQPKTFTIGTKILCTGVSIYRDYVYSGACARNPDSINNDLAQGYVS